MRWIVMCLVLVLAGCADVAPEPVNADPDMRHAALGARPIEGERRSVDFVEATALGIQFVQTLTVDIDHEIVFAGELPGSCIAGCPLPIFAFDVPDEYLDGWIDVRVYWDGTQNAGFEFGPNGTWAQRGHDVARFLDWGNHSTSPLIYGEGPFAGTVRYRHVDLAAVPGGDLRPNLVTLTPAELFIGACNPEEQVEQGAERCLRLGNAVGNVGDGPLEVHLSVEEGVMAGLGQGRFTQRIYAEEGHRDVPASGAEVHVVHGHFHYAGLAHFQLFEHDVETGLRGEQVAAGNKRGFCFIDIGDMESPEAPSQGAQRAQQGCLVPDAAGWSMGVTRGMYDYYWPTLADQYIDIAGVPDGTYELVSIADGDDTLVETDETDNNAALLIEIRGDALSLLDVRSFYDNPEGPPL